MLSISCGDLMDPGRNIVLFLDNFSPFQNKDETRIASSPVYFQYDVMPTEAKNANTNKEVSQ